MSGDSVYGGIDVAKKSLEAGTTSGKSQKFCYTKPGLRQMTDLLKKEKVCLVVMEATGRLEEKAAHAIEKAGIPVAVVNPVRVRRFAQSEGRLAKTDRIDAEVIADFAEAMDRRGRLYTRFQKSEAQAEIDSLADRRRELVGMLAAEKSRLKGVSTAKARRSQERHLKWLQDEIDRIEKEIREAAAKDEETTSKIKLLRSVPGVGDVTATTLIGDLPELGKVSNPRIASP
jgi:transposase